MRGKKSTWEESNMFWLLIRRRRCWDAYRARPLFRHQSLGEFRSTTRGRGQEKEGNLLLPRCWTQVFREQTALCPAPGTVPETWFISVRNVNRSSAAVCVVYTDGLTARPQPAQPFFCVGYCPSTRLLQGSLSLSFFFRRQCSLCQTGTSSPQAALPAGF